MEGLNQLVKSLRLLYVLAEIRCGCLQHSSQNRHRLDQHSVFFTSCLSRDSLTVVTVLDLYYHLRKHTGQRPKCCVYKMYRRQCLMSNIILL